MVYHQNEFKYILVIKSMGDLNNNFILLADPEAPSWNFAQSIKDYIEKLDEDGETQIPLREVKIKKFRNGEIGLHIPQNIRKRNVYFIQNSNQSPQDWWVELLLIKDLLLSSSAGKVTFVLPDMYYSRQDRKDRPRVPISARALARSISPNLERIITMDLHADQIQGFFPEEVPVDNLYSFPVAVRYLIQNHPEYAKNLAVVSPDAGSANRVRRFYNNMIKAKELPPNSKISISIMDKERSAPGEVGSINLLGRVKGKNVIVPDDIIDSGGTLCYAAKALRSKGAKKLICYGTHGLFTNGLDDLSKYFDLILTSNTHYQKPHKKLEMVDVAPLFAEAVYREETGRSISKLFEF